MVSGLKTAVPVIASVLILAIGSASQESSAQYYSNSMGTIMDSNFGFSATLTDMYGDTSFYSINLGSSGSSSSYYASQMEEYTSQFKDFDTSDYDTAPVTYKPGKDLECDGKLITVDEMIGEQADFLYVESTEKVQGNPVFVTDCTINIHSLDGSFGVFYYEAKFTSSDLAATNYPGLVDNQFVDYALKNGGHQENNLGSNSNFFYVDKADRHQYQQYFQKDQYIVYLVSDGYKDFTIIGKEQVPVWANIIRDRVNPHIYSLETDGGRSIQLDPCNALLSEDRVEGIIGVNQAVGKSGWVTNDIADAVGWALPPGANVMCLIDYNLLDSSDTNGKIQSMIFFYDSEDFAESVYEVFEKMSQELPNDSWAKGPQGNSFFSYSDGGNSASAVFQQGRTLSILQIGRFDSNQGSSFELTDNVLQELVSTSSDNLNALFSGIEEQLKEKSEPVSKPSEPVSVQSSGGRITYDITGGKVLEYTFDENNGVIIQLEAYSDGELIIVLPRDVIDVIWEGEDGYFDILGNDSCCQDYEETKTSTERTLTIPFTKLDFLGDPFTKIGIYGNYINPDADKIIEPEPVEEQEPIVESESTETQVPTWIKNNAKWWSEGQIGDSDFVGGIQHMIKEDIIAIPDLPETTESVEETVPDWVKNNAGWWADGLISEDDFVNGIKYLVEHGIIRV